MTGILKRYPPKKGSPLPCDDATYTIRYVPSNVVIQAGSVVSGGSVTVDVPDPVVPSGWNPPADWKWDLAEVLVSDGDNAFVGIYACYPDINNSVAFQASFTGTATIDWGDGSAPEAVTSGVTIMHTFVYAGITQAVTSWGFKPCVVKFNATGACSVMNFGLRNTLDRASSTHHWMCLKIRSTFTGATPFQYSVPSQVFPYNLHLLDFGDTLLVRPFGILQNHKALQKLTLNFSLMKGIVAASSLISDANIYNVDWNSYDWSAWTDLSWAFFNGKGGIPYALDIDVTACTTIASFLRQASNFSTVKLRNSGNITDVSGAIFNNSSVMSFQMDDASGVTTTTSFTFSGLSNLKRLIMTGLTRGLDLTNCMMQATALNAFFTSLGAAAGAQTIVVTGNPGAATCDTTIATGKGFTVTT